MTNVLNWRTMEYRLHYKHSDLPRLPGSWNHTKQTSQTAHGQWVGQKPSCLLVMLDNDVGPRATSGNVTETYLLVSCFG